ncbi:MAG: magnesium/cobalt transporter CorA [Thermoanaerobaculia bacterium]
MANHEPGPGVLADNAAPTSGIINCIAYREGRRVRALEIEEIAAALEDPEVFVWIGLYEPDEALLERVQGAFELHDLAIEDAHRAHQRPKLDRYGDSLFLVLRTAQFEGEGTRLEFGETHVFAGRRYVVTVRHGSRKAHLGVRDRCEAEPGDLALGPGYVLYSLLDFVVDQYFPILEQLEDQFERIEVDVFDGQSERETTKRIYDLRSDLVYLKRAVFPLIDVCQRLERLEGPLMPEEIRVYVHDVQDHLLKMHEMLENLREMSASALEAHFSLLTIAQGDETRRLASWAAIIAVPTMVAGIYGMNFRFMPELGWRLGYPFVLGGMALLCLLLYRAFKRSGWL